jgi:hypothetical protein
LGKRRLNLNNYELCGEADATLEITPLKVDGVSQPTLYFKSKRKSGGAITIKDLESGNAKWTPVVNIDISCSEDDYKTLVDWWFTEATEEYRTNVANSYSRIPNLLETINNVRAWLMTTGAYTISARGKFNKRKKNIHRFLTNWLNREIDSSTRGRR